MKKVFLIICFVILIMPMITFLSEGNAQGQENKTEYNVAINKGTINYSLYKAIEKVINNYNWVVDDLEYVFYTTRVNWRDNPDYLNPRIYDLHYIDGVTDELGLCVRLPVVDYDDNFRDKFRDYLEDGGAYIGRCGGSQLPPTYDESNPDTFYEYYLIDQNGFLESTPEVKDHIKMGYPIVSQITEMKYKNIFIPFPRLGLRFPPEPGAIGAGVYNIYNMSTINGVCLNLEIEEKDHPILKDYYGDTIYSNCQPSASFPYPPEYVDVLVRYPTESFNTRDNQKINIWKFKMGQAIVNIIKKLIALIGEGIFQFDIDDLPPEWQDLFDDDGPIIAPQIFEFLFQDLSDWEKTNDIAETELQNRPAIIAFDYGKGRVVLSAPHTACDIWPEDAYIENNDDTDCDTTRKGLYHWICNGEDMTKDSHRSPNTDLYWYQRREAAWAVGVPDESLPPVYGRSHVVDIPYIQESMEFPVYCCVARENNSNWTWSDVNLTLQYQYGDDPYNYNWSNYSSIYSRPYNFTFNASNCNGSGIYKFQSILSTMNTSSEIWTRDDPPPDYDAIVNVKGNISADFACNVSHAYAQQAVLFNSSKSTTTSGTNITSYNWSFGDGATSNSSNPIHTFTDDGIYDVTLAVTNNELASGNNTYSIVVYNNPPIADFESDFSVMFVNEQINFTEYSSDIDGNISQYKWDFGDGSNSTVQNSSHTYTNSGFYDVTFEVNDDDNANSKKVCNIFVIDSLVNKSIAEGGNKWNKAQDAIDNSTLDNYILIEEGLYSEDININKSITLVGEDRDNVVFSGSLSLSNPYDYELPNNKEIDFNITVDMTGNQLLLHFNNDAGVGENYSSSNLIYDYSGEGNNGNNSGASWTTNALKGQGSFNFNGVDNSINFTSINALTGENVTVSAWVYWTDGTGDSDVILSQSNITNGYCLYVNSSDGKPVFMLDDVVAKSSIALSSDKWHYVVGTHNETSLKIYIDGMLRGDTSKIGTGIDTYGFIGFDNISQYYNGLIDEVAVWNRTLSDNEINLIYNGNYGIQVMGLSFKDSEIGISVCNHSEISYCILFNHTVGIELDEVSDIRVHMCNISDVETGIKVVNSNPESVYFNRIVDVVIDNVTSAIEVENSSYLYFIRTIVNGSSTNLSFNNCDYNSISMINCNSVNNIDPDVPYITGPSYGDIDEAYMFSAVSNDSNEDQVLYRFDWGDGTNSGWVGFYSSNETFNMSHSWSESGNYQVIVKVKDVFDNESISSSTFIIDILPPIINSVNLDPTPVGFGGNVTILANIIDNETGGHSGIQYVKVNISSPSNECLGNFTMAYIGNDVSGNDVFRYVFNNTWKVGQYNCTIWACDNASNTIFSSGYYLNVTANANITICTIKDSYGENMTVNLTDPPGPPSSSIGYDLLDDDSVLHMWNKFDSYYFNTSNGIQFTNHKDEYWSHNVLMLGYYIDDEWNLIYRTDELSGFNKDIESDDETYVNATLWKDLSYGGYDFRLAIRYHLGVDDNELTIIPYIKNIDDEDIPYVLGFAWEIKDIQVDMTSENDYIEIDGTWYYLNGTIDETYTDLDLPCYYIREDKSENTFESLYLKWDEDLNYKVLVESRDGQYNAPVTLGIKIGTLDIGQEKYTEMFWHDASEVTYYFNNYDPGEAWPGNPANMVDGSISTKASVNNIIGPSYVELCNGNTYPRGTDLGTISKVELRVYGYYSGSQRDIILRPVFGGTDDGSNYTFQTPWSPSWSSWFDITNDNDSTSEQWSWEEDIAHLDCDVEAESYPGMWTLYCSKVEIRVTYTPHPTEIFDPYPADGSTGVSIQPMLNITVSDPQGDTMNITWLSNSSGSWQVFGTNSSVGNGTYHQVFANATENGKWWYWKVNVSDGDGYTESDVFSFYTGNQSLIMDVGDMDIKGYLLIQVQFYNDTLEDWVVADDTINETSWRRINSSDYLALDTIFNGNVITNDLIASHGYGSYRVYAAFRDPDGDVLVCDDESLMETTYEFTITY